MIVLSPPNKDHVVENKIVFLAGAIQGAEDWQSKIIDELSEYDISIANPRKKYIDDAFDYEKQVAWESYFLKKADIIIFWLPKENETIQGRAYAQTSRFELGEWLAKQLFEEYKKKIIIGIEDGFSGKRYIQTRIKHDYEWVQIVYSLKELILKIKECFNYAN